MGRSEMRREVATHDPLLAPVGAVGRMGPCVGGGGGGVVSLGTIIDEEGSRTRMRRDPRRHDPPLAPAGAAGRMCPGV